MTVQALLEPHDERIFYFVVGLVAGRHLREHVLSDVDVEKCRLHVHLVHLVVQLRRDCDHDADALEHSHASEGATAIDDRDLRKSLHDESTLVGTARLHFEHPPGVNQLVFRRD